MPGSSGRGWDGLAVPSELLFPDISNCNNPPAQQWYKAWMWKQTKFHFPFPQQFYKEHFSVKGINHTRYMRSQNMKCLAPKCRGTIKIWLLAAWITLG